MRLELPNTFPDKAKLRIQIQMLILVICMQARELVNHLDVTADSPVPAR